MVMSAFLRAEMILESYAEVDSNQFTTRNTPYQLVQCSTVPSKKKLQISGAWLPVRTVRTCEPEKVVHKNK